MLKFNKTNGLDIKFSIVKTDWNGKEYVKKMRTLSKIKLTMFVIF